MVRYSIEAGLVGPGVRVFLGGLFALALLARRRMDTPQGEHLRDRGAADRQHSGDPHRCRNGGGFRDRLCGLCALWLPRARQRLRPARPRRTRHARRGAAARAGARGPRRGRRIRDADARLLRQAGLLGALHLSRHRHRRGFGLARIRLWRWLAVTTIVFAVLWTFPGLDADPRWSRRTPSM